MLLLCNMDIDREIFDDVEDALPSEFLTMTAEGIAQRTRLLENEIRVLRDEGSRMGMEQSSLKEKIKENKVSERVLPPNDAQKPHRFSCALLTTSHSRRRKSS